MKKYLFIFIAMTFVMLNTVEAYLSNNAMANVEIPIFTLKNIVGKSHTTIPSKNIIQTCYIYKDITILEVNDPGLMGNAKLTIRFNKNHQNTPTILCDQKDKPSDIINPKDSISIVGYFEAKYINYILIGGADNFGSGREFLIIQINSTGAHSIYKGIALDNGKQLVQFIKNNTNKIGIEYWKRLESSCSLMDSNKRHCWKEILRKNHIRNAIMPNCKKSYTMNHASNATPSLVFIPVKIENLKNQKIEYLNQRSDCWPSP